MEGWREGKIPTDKKTNKQGKISALKTETLALIPPNSPGAWKKQVFPQLGNHSFKQHSLTLLLSQGRAFGFQAHRTRLRTRPVRGAHLCDKISTSNAQRSDTDCTRGWTFLSQTRCGKWKLAFLVLIVGLRKVNFWYGFTSYSSEVKFLPRKQGFSPKAVRASPGTLDNRN